MIAFIVFIIFMKKGSIFSFNLSSLINLDLQDIQTHSSNNFIAIDSMQNVPRALSYYRESLSPYIKQKCLYDNFVLSCCKEFAIYYTNIN